MTSVNLILAGLGNVGRAFIRLVEEKRPYCRARYGLDLRIAAAFKSDGGMLAKKNVGLRWPQDIQVVDFKSHSDWIDGLKVREAFSILAPGVLVECTPSNFDTGEPGLGYMRQALHKGWHIAVASKGALVLKFRELRALAIRKKAILKYSGATAAALPTLDVGTISLAGAEILGIEGILTGVTNYILTRMEEGGSFDEALKFAQAKGMAEPDPALDIDGWDSSAKIVLITNSVVGTDLSLAEVHREGIRNVRPDEIKKAVNEGRRLKLLARYFREKNGQAKAEVRITRIDKTHPLYHVSGTNKGITFFTDTMGSVTLTGGKSDPRGTAAALLKDIINIYC
jgi:homoserine dehydrogenase